MTEVPDSTVWRVGYAGDPLGFVPHDRSGFGHRFDDPQRRFRSLYAALLPETSLREVLADLRPNAAAMRRFVETFGEDAVHDVPAQRVTASWRRKNRLAPASIVIDHGCVLDLTDPTERHAIELRHADLLQAHGLDHLDMPEITTRRRIVTQAIAADAYDDLDVAVIRFPSSRDGNPCYVLLETRARLESAGPSIPLTDPAPEALVNVCAGWRLALEPAPVLASGPAPAHG